MIELYWNIIKSEDEIFQYC